jgi:hypothetical protein
MVSLLLLVIVLTVAMSMLFQMRAFAERQQFFMLPRQTARRAVDYLSYYIAGASDLNVSSNSPNALVVYYNLGAPGVPIQASYDNLDGTEAGNAVTVPTVSTKFGDLGTDVITLLAPTNPARYLASPTFGGLGPGIDLYFNFRGGCATNDAANVAAFKTATGFDGTTQSALLTLVDKNGDWIYFQIPSAGYLTDGLCSDTATYKNIHVKADTQSASLPAPPNGTANLADPIFLITGIQVISFRVLTDPVDNVPKLQQKLGLFDPSSDNPGTAFVNVMENVEDLQIAYVYATEPVGLAGTFWNTATNDLRTSPPGVAAGVPPQAGPTALAGPTDVAKVIGIRFSVTSRSPRLSLGAQDLTNVRSSESLATTNSLHFRPASENHPIPMNPLAPTQPAYDLFDHYRATSMLMLRNRTLGS